MSDEKKGKKVRLIDNGNGAYYVSVAGLNRCAFTRRYYFDDNGSGCPFKDEHDSRNRFRSHSQ